MAIGTELWREIEDLCGCYPRRQGALLPVLRRIQEQQGYLPEKMLSELAEYLRVPQVDLFEAATFYTLLYTSPKGENLVMACNNLTCYLLDGECVVLDTLKQELGIEEGQTTDDNKFTLQGVSCLGACDKGPVMMINGNLYTHLTREKVVQIIREY